MKFIAPMALLAMAELDTVAAGGRCSFTMKTWDDIDCTEGGADFIVGENIKIGKCTLCAGCGPLDDEDMYLYLPFCDSNVGMAMYAYSDENCETFYDGMSPDWGCPAGDCCHLAVDSLSFFGLGIALGYDVTIDGQRGSEYGLGMFGAVGQIFKAMIGV